ncbi:LPS export ABC transporter permease LptF [Elongatibacter sediminis]|uniref:Lipopolysaccharide export system permease protein LptF n=1 Tax=Elongatibacter sediminis TaxID=3119006 RepID=A0AAW9RC01_9GAMM
MIVDRYMMREVGLPFAAVAGVLVVIFASYSLTRHLVDANAGLLLPGEVFRLTALRALISLEVLLPLSFFLAVMIGMGRLYSDSEIYAMRGGGISERRLMRPVMMLALLLAVVTAGLSLAGRPWAYSTAYQLRAEASAAAEIDRIREARFYRFGETGRTVFIEHMNAGGNTVNGIFVRHRDGDDIEVITAVNGQLEQFARPDHHRLVLFDAQVFKRVAGAPDLVARFGSFSLWLPVGEPEPVGHHAKASPSMSLESSSDPTDRAEWQWRLSTPVSALLLALLAIPLSRGRPRQGRFGRIIVALGLYAVYFNLLDVSRTWVEQGSVRTIWWAPGVLFVVTLGLYLPWARWFGRMRNRRGATA